MSVVWQVLQFILTVIETGLCFAFNNMLTGTEYPERWKRVVQGIAVLVIAYLWASNRQYVMVSNLELFVCGTLAFVVIVIIGNKDYVLISGIALFYLVSGELLSILYGTVLQFYLGIETYLKRVHLGNPTGWRILIYLATILTILCIYKVIRDKKKQFDISRIGRIFLVMGFMEWWALTWTIGQVFEQQRDRSLWTVSILLVLILGLTAFFMLYISYLMERSINEKIELKNQMAEKSYEETKHLIENSMLNFHDWKNHILVLQNYLEQKEIDKANSYLKKIGASVEILSQHIWCENEVINLIINTKLIEAQEKDVSISVEVKDVIGEIEDYDLCSILSNLIDNAIEACEGVASEKRWISIVIQGKSNMVIIKITNSISKIPRIKHREFISDKEGQHGYGLKSVKSAVNKNDGVIKFEHDAEMFSVTITFFR